MAERLNSFSLEGVKIEGAYSVESCLATKNFQGRESDIHLTSYPRTGTAWTQNILVGIVYGLDLLEDLDSPKMRPLFPYLEMDYVDGLSGSEVANQSTRNPRMLKNHMPPNLAPQEIFSLGRKNIVIARNPKDTALSYFKFYQTNPNLMKFYTSNGLEDFLDKFLEGDVAYGSWWIWTKSWIDKCRAHPENHLLIHYEDIHQNFLATVQKLVQFLDISPMSDESIAVLRTKTSVENMKSRYEQDPKQRFIINKGEMHGWRRSFPEGYSDKFDKLTIETFGKADSVIEKFI